MGKVLFNKIKTYLLIIVSLSLIIISVQLYKEKQENKRQYDIFLNTFHYHLTSTIQSLNSVLEKPMEGEDLKLALQEVANNLKSTDEILGVGSRFVVQDIYNVNSIFKLQPVEQFGEEQTLTKIEIDYLKNLKKDLDHIHKGLSSEETEWEHRNLNTNEFNNIITGSELKSGFLTADKSIDIPFQVIGVEQAPMHIQRWVKQNSNTEQIQVFLIDEKPYVVIVPNHEQLHETVITQMVRKGGVIEVSHIGEEHSTFSKSGPAVMIAELGINTKRSFQFTTAIEVEEESNTSNDNPSIQTASGGASVELIIPKMLLENGEIVE